MYHLVTGRPPFDGDTPSAVMHKHLKQPLMPPDHINTALSAGIGEIIEVAMAKNRDDRYRSHRGHARRPATPSAPASPPSTPAARSTSSNLAKIEETGKTVDIEPHRHTAGIWGNPIVVTLLIICGLSLFVNLILLVVALT